MHMHMHMRRVPHVLDLDADSVGRGEGPNDGKEVPHEEDGVARHRKLRSGKVGWARGGGGVWR